MLILENYWPVAYTFAMKMGNGIFPDLHLPMDQQLSIKNRIG